jgi:hypothetical protein
MDMTTGTRAPRSGARQVRSWLRPVVAGCSVGLALVSLVACGGSKNSTFGNNGSSSGSTSSSGLFNNNPTNSADGGSQNELQFGTGTAITCAAGTNMSCTGNNGCAAGTSTTIKGKVYDPADVNPLYSVTVYVPGVPQSQFPDLTTLGVQATLDGGAPFCSCDGFYPPIVASAVTMADGSFEIDNAPFGTLSIVVQTGKWRMVYDNVTITQCQDNEIADKTLRLPRNASEGSLPEIAISSGGADSLECLPLRIGVDASEYTSGAGGTGHIHIFQGYHGATTPAAAPASNVALWNSDANLEQNDVTLLSCEGSETHGMTAGDQQNLVDYSNNGGRVFLSHYHYAWLRTGPFAADNLATWVGNDQTPEQVDPADKLGFPGDVDTTFYEGNEMSMWLGNVNALTPNSAIPAAACPDCGGVTGALPIFYGRHNVVTLTQPPTNEWIHLDPSVTQAPSATQYFSFDTPVGGLNTAETMTCGRVVYSDLHVSGGPGTSVPPGCAGSPPSCFAADYGNAAGMQGGTVPNQCRGYGTAPDDVSRTLSPQEKALEFMLFDLSSCLVPVGMPPMNPGMIR